jgi:endonuclease-3
MASGKPRKPARATKPAGEAKRPARGAQQVAERLALAIPQPRCELNFQSGFQLLIATILSAQSTDKAVNTVTPELFARYPDPRRLADAPLEELEVLIKRTGFFRAKSKSIKGAAQKLVSDFGAEVPRTLEELISLPGVARKTANVVLGTAYRIASGFVVDTHIARVARRLALSHETEPAKIERDLCAQFPESTWIDMGHRLLLHGRYTCLARAPQCGECPLNELCPSRIDERPAGSWQERAQREAARVEQGMQASA